MEIKSKEQLGEIKFIDPMEDINLFTTVQFMDHGWNFSNRNGSPISKAITIRAAIVSFSEQIWTKCGKFSIYPIYGKTFSLFIRFASEKVWIANRIEINWNNIIFYSFLVISILKFWLIYLSNIFIWSLYNYEKNLFF